MLHGRSPIAVGLIGYGYSGRTFHAPLISSTEGMELRAVASSQAGSIHSDLPVSQVHADAADLIGRGDIDLIVIATPNDTHEPLARSAILSGKHVVVDKPFALDLTQARALTDLAAERGILLSVFHNRRWDSDFMSVRKAIEDGAVGRVTHFESHFDRMRPEVRDRWRERAGPGSGVWFDLGPHLVDQALQIFGLPDSIQADLAIQRDGAIADDWAHAVLRYGSTRVILHASMLVAGGQNRFTVHGTAGTLVKRMIDPQEEQLVSGMRPGAPGWGVDEDPLVLIDASGGQRSIAALPGDQRQFYVGIRDALNGSGPAPVAAADALAVMAIIEAGAASSKTRSATKMPPIEA